MADVDSKLVKAIAARVLAALAEKPAAVRAPVGQCTGDYSKFVELKGLQSAPPPTSAMVSPPAKTVLAVAPAVEEKSLSGVITVLQLQKAGANVRLAKGARLTPLAQDYMRDGHVTIVGGEAREAVAQRHPVNQASSPREAAKSSERKIDMTQNMFQLKQEMCEIGHRIWLKGFCAGNEGNHSVRIGDNRVLSTPTGFSKGFLKPDMITVVDMEGNQVDKENKHKRTSEILLHLQIYNKRPDVRAIIHSHPPHATAFACAGVPIPEGVHPEAEVFLGKVPTAKYTTPSYKELGESVCKLINAETNTVLLGNHGTVNFAPSLMEAYYKLEIVDSYCRMLLLLKQIGKVNLLSQQEMVDLLKVKHAFGIADQRLACAPDGCIGSDNQPYLSTFPAGRGASASCDCDTGKVVRDAAAGGGAGMDEKSFEAMVQRVTDQIMATVK